MDARRQTYSKEDERLKEYVLVNLCSVITTKEIDRLLKLTKNEFKRKHRVNKIMLGKIDEVVKETEKILTKVLLDNQYEVNMAKGYLEEPNMTSQINLEADQTIDDTYENAEVSVQEEVGEEDTRKAKERKDKVENPLTVVVDPPVSEKNAEKEKSGCQG